MVEVTIQDVETKETRNGGSRYIVKTDQGIFNTKDQNLARTLRSNQGQRARFEFNSTDFNGQEWRWINEDTVQVIAGQAQPVAQASAPLPSSAPLSVLAPPPPAPAPQASSRSSEFRSPEQIMRGIAVESVGPVLQYLDDVSMESLKATLDVLYQYQVDGVFPTTTPSTNSVPY